LKPQIYKVGKYWIVWVPGVRVFRFPNWNDALDFALDAATRTQTEPPPPVATAKATAAANAN